MVSFTLNEEKFEVEKDTTVLEAALRAGVKIPNLCYHEELSSYGACRLCLVEIDQNGKTTLETSCQTEVSEGMKVKTDTERVLERRRMIFELLLAKAPESRKLREMAVEHGVTESRFNFDSMGKCTLCGLCVRVCAEIVEREAITFSNRGVKKSIKTPFGKVSEDCIGCGACAYICPTDAIEVEEAH